MAVRNSARLCFAYWFLLMSLPTGYCREWIWHQNAALSDVIPLDVDVTSPLAVESEMGCARQCQAKEVCNSFFYNDVSKACLRQKMVYVAPANMTSAPGWRYFRLISACPMDKAYIADRVTGTCYRLVLTTKKIWVDARDSCAENNEVLAVLEPVDKASFIRDFFSVNKACPMDKAYIADRVTGTCYRLVLTTKKIWVDARDSCAENNEVLAVLEPVDKASFIRDFFSVNKGIASKNVFIGAKRPTASVPFPPTGPDFVWLNGQAVNITATAPFWVPGEPSSVGSNQFIRLNGALDYGWSDAQGMWFQDYICERPFFR